MPPQAQCCRLDLASTGTAGETGNVSVRTGVGGRDGVGVEPYNDAGDVHVGGCYGGRTRARSSRRTAGIAGEGDGEHIAPASRICVAPSIEATHRRRTQEYERVGLSLAREKGWRAGWRTCGGGGRWRLRLVQRKVLDVSSGWSSGVRCVTAPGNVVDLPCRRTDVRSTCAHRTMGLFTRLSWSHLRDGRRPSDFGRLPPSLPILLLSPPATRSVHLHSRTGL